MPHIHLFIILGLFSFFSIVRASPVDKPLPGRSGVVTDPHTNVVHLHYGDDELPGHMGHVERHYKEHPTHDKPWEVKPKKDESNRNEALEGHPTAPNHPLLGETRRRDEKMLNMMKHDGKTTVEWHLKSESDREGGYAGQARKQLDKLPAGATPQLHIHTNPGWHSRDPKQVIAHEAPAKLESGKFYKVPKKAPKNPPTHEEKMAKWGLVPAQHPKTGKSRWDVAPGPGQPHDTLKVPANWRPGDVRGPNDPPLHDHKSSKLPPPRPDTESRRPDRPQTPLTPSQRKKIQKLKTTDAKAAAKLKKASAKAGVKGPPDHYPSPEKVPHPVNPNKEAPAIMKHHTDGPVAKVSIEEMKRHAREKLGLSHPPAANHGTPSCSRLSARGLDGGSCSMRSKSSIALPKAHQHPAAHTLGSKKVVASKAIHDVKPQSKVLSKSLHASRPLANGHKSAVRRTPKSSTHSTDSKARSHLGSARSASPHSSVKVKNVPKSASHSSRTNARSAKARVPSSRKLSTSHRSGSSSPHREAKKVKKAVLRSPARVAHIKTQPQTKSPRSVKKLSPARHSKTRSHLGSARSATTRSSVKVKSVPKSTGRSSRTNARSAKAKTPSSRKLSVPHRSGSSSPHREAKQAKKAVLRTPARAARIKAQPHAKSARSAKKLSPPRHASSISQKATRPSTPKRTTNHVVKKNGVKPAARSAHSKAQAHPKARQPQKHVAAVHKAKSPAVPIRAAANQGRSRASAVHTPKKVSPKARVVVAKKAPVRAAAKVAKPTPRAAVKKHTPPPARKGKK